MDNEELRKMMKEDHIYLWQVAEKLEIHETTLVKKFRRELPSEQAKAVLSAIQEIKLDRLKEQG